MLRIPKSNRTSTIFLLHESRLAFFFILMRVQSLGALTFPTRKIAIHRLDQGRMKDSRFYPRVLFPDHEQTTLIPMHQLRCMQSSIARACKHLQMSSLAKRQRTLNQTET